MSELERKYFKCGECDPKEPCTSSACFYTWDDEPPCTCLTDSALCDWVEIGFFTFIKINGAEDEFVRINRD